MSGPQDFGSMFAGQPPQYPAAPSLPVTTPTTNQPPMELVNSAAASPAPPRPSSQDVNPATLCRLGQETVQEIILRTNDFFQGLKTIQPPNGSLNGAAIATEKKARVQEQLRNLSLLMRRLRLVYDKCCDLTKNLDMSYTHAESLIPLKDEWDGKGEERKQTEAYRQAVAERAALKDQVSVINQEIKDAVDLQRRTVWEINTMLAMKKS